MTIKEWLKMKIKAAQVFVGEFLLPDSDAYLRAFGQGYLEALKDVGKALPKLDHDVTLNEVKRMCKDSCEDCPLVLGPPVPMGCQFEVSPQYWNIKEIEKRIREAKKN